MPLGKEVGLGPGHIVLDGDPAPPPQKGGTAQPHPIFGPCLLWPNGWMDQDATWYGHIVLHGNPVLPKKGTQTPIFGPWLLWSNGRPSQLLLSACRYLLSTTLVAQAEHRFWYVCLCLSDNRA